MTAVSLIVREVEPAERDTATGVLVRSMSDNPIQVYLLAGDPMARRRRLKRVFRTSLDHLLRGGVVLGAYRDSEPVGVLGMMPPHRSQPTAIEALRMLPVLFVALGLSGILRAGKWFGELAKHVPSEPHWHIGPVAVDAHLQGQGIGSALMAECCARIDATGVDAYLETDKQINLSFYERFGFHICGETRVVGSPVWFMHRPARR